MWDSWAMDTHHPLLPLDNKIENIPLEVERQQGWGPNWGGNGDGGVVSSMRVTNELAGAGGMASAISSCCLSSCLGTPQPSGAIRH